MFLEAGCPVPLGMKCFGERRPILPLCRTLFEKLVSYGPISLAQGQESPGGWDSFSAAFIQGPRSSTHNAPTNAAPQRGSEEKRQSLDNSPCRVWYVSPSPKLDQVQLDSLIRFRPGEFPQVGMTTESIFHRDSNPHLKSLEELNSCQEDAA